MKSFSIAMAVAGLSLVAPLGQAAEITAQTLVDRAQIEDLIARYYNGSRGNPETLSQFYAENAELVLGSRSYKGRGDILQAYRTERSAAETPRRKPPTLANLKPQVYGNAAERRTAARSIPGSAPASVVKIGNPVIVVDGDTATAQLVFTEYATGKSGQAPKPVAQGRELGKFVKVDGQWRYLRREIVAGGADPAFDGKG
ncbi:nuclear transport factor 2 family protein [bacterium]|nr:MAG: nuclear transport factor 2 family protein [bacterium]